MTNASAILTWVLCGFFVLGAVANVSGLPIVRESYARWGYPPWFRYITGMLEFSAAALIIAGFPLPGLAVGFVVMTAATLTLIRSREYLHTVPGAVVMLLIIAAVSMHQGVAGFWRFA